MSNIIELKNVNFSYWKHEVLKDVNLTIKNWEILWFLWANGSWKSTSMKLMSWLLKLKEWSYKFQWEDFSLEKLNEIWAIINHPHLYWDLNAYDNVKVFANLSNVKFKKVEIDELLDLVGLYKDSRKKKIKTYSTWMKNTLAIAIALIWKPKLLILDEITSGLDVEAKDRIRSLLTDLKNKWYSIIFSSHELDQIQKVSDRIAIISNKNIKFEWTLEEMLKHWNDVEESYINLTKK